MLSRFQHTNGQCGSDAERTNKGAWKRNKPYPMALVVAAETSQYSINSHAQPSHLALTSRSEIVKINNHKHNSNPAGRQ